MIKKKKIALLTTYSQVIKYIILFKAGINDCALHFTWMIVENEIMKHKPICTKSLCSVCYVLLEKKHKTSCQGVSE